MNPISRALLGFGIWFAAGMLYALLDRCFGHHDPPPEPPIKYVHPRR